MIGPYSAIVIATSQHRRQSLAALLRSMPEFGDIYEAENVGLLRPNTFLRPSIIVFDCWQGEKVSQNDVNTVHDLFPGVRCLALIKQVNPPQSSPDVDCTLTEGFTMDLFFEATRRLLKIAGAYIK